MRSLKQLVSAVRRRGLAVASAPSEMRIERRNQAPLVCVEVYPWWPDDVRRRILTAALDAALDALPRGYR